MLIRKMRSATEAIDQLDDCRNLDELTLISSCLAEFLGFRYIECRAVLKGGANADASLSFDNYPPSREAQFRHFLSLAPRFIPKDLFENSFPRLWFSGGSYEEESAWSTRSVTACEISGGIVCPVHSRNGDSSLVSWTAESGIDDDDLQTYFESRIALCVLTALHIHEALRRIHRLASQQQIGRLTERETECLRWIGAGKSTWEIAQILGISEHGVLHHVRKVMDKFGVSRRHDAVRAAQALNLI
jgi:LuxR family quorum-sensing transcriptional regulator LasR